MITEKIERAASELWAHFTRGTKLDALPPEHRPADRAEGYRVQTAVARKSGDAIVGFKIAATSQAGQKHIGVDGPLGAPLLASRVVKMSGAVPVCSMDGNIMKVAEAEFAFKFGKALPKRDAAYTMDEVLAAVESLHPSIEVPDSRYSDFVKVGAPQLIADCACAFWFALGPATRADWRTMDLVNHPVTALINGKLVATGKGANVLGDPRVALTWLVNEMSTYGDGVAAGQFVTTGTCVVPPAVTRGDRFTADFGTLGAVEVDLR